MVHINKFSISFELWARLYINILYHFYLLTKFPAWINMKCLISIDIVMVMFPLATNVNIHFKEYHAQCLTEVAFSGLYFLIKLPTCFVLSLFMIYIVLKTFYILVT